VSRNDKIRKMASKLPKFPKLDGKKVQYDSKGEIIYVDHFREFKKIQQKHMDMGKSSRDPEILKEWGRYSTRVMEYDRIVNKKRGILDLSWIELTKYLIVFIMVAFTLSSLLEAIGFTDFYYQLKNNIRQLLK
jgi:hypothetical protein